MGKKMTLEETIDAAEELASHLLSGATKGDADHLNNQMDILMHASISIIGTYLGNQIVLGGWDSKTQAGFLSTVVKSITMRTNELIESVTEGTAEKCFAKDYDENNH